VAKPRKICYDFHMKWDSAKTYIAALGRKYLWWDAVGDGSHSEDRVIAQAMNLGTFDDILALEQMVGKHRLVEIMLQAEPGWFSDRSWEFWRGRLSRAAEGGIPEEPPRRSLHAAEL
jgi:hypothetical protein